MGLGQTLLTIMALMLMGRTILNMNTATLNSGFTKDLSEYRIAATSLGTSAIEMSSALAFDESTAVPLDTSHLAKTAATTSELCAPASFGPDGAETFSTFNDIDDYNNYVHYDTLQGIPYSTKVTVTYIDPNSATLAATTIKTFSKKITVYVTSPYLLDYTRDTPTQDTLTFQTVYSYWYFR